MTRSVAWLVVLGVVLAVAGAPPAGASGGGWPLPGAVVRGLDPPEVRWAAGHRGVDLAGEPGEVVRAPVAGVVSFAGQVGGKPVVVVSHGAERTTLEPVHANVAVGQAVASGDEVGRLAAGHAPCPAAACLHWGLRRGQDYLDPLSLVDASLRLLPDSAVAEVEERAAGRERAAAALGTGPGGPGGSGPLTRPSAGRVTSVFGMRLHPIFKQWRMHNGIDLSAPCGTPLYAAADGVVRHMGFDASGGWRLVLAHGPVDGVGLETVYLHAQGYRVRTGEQVARGQLVGTMGTTGWSTGCHLHFGVKADGRHVDPQRWLG